MNRNSHKETIMKPVLRSHVASGIARLWLAAMLTGLLPTAAVPAPARRMPANLEFQLYQLHTGLHTNRAAHAQLGYTNVIRAVGAPSKVRVHFYAFNLGRHSYVTLTSVRDGGKQKLDATTMGYWGNTSAIFNGHEVKMELHVAPGDEGVFAQVGQLVAECDCPDTALNRSSSDLPESLCTTDNRVASGDNRVGRISGCTAWLVSNGAVLTAGHCGPLGGVFEVNVPASSSSGAPTASAPEDQYPLAGGATCVDNGKGDDYCVFSLNPNTTNGDRPHITHGFFRMTREAPAASATIRITGFGVDNTPAGTGSACCARDGNGNCTHFSCNAQSRTLQTATGPYVGETTATLTDIYHSYQTDTEPANSGSPIIWNANGFTIGIHTHGGCASDGTGDNDGTSFENTNLETALQGFPGASTEYVDGPTYPNAPAENGNIFMPWNTVTEAVTAVAAGGRILIVEGSYTAAAGNTMTMGADGKSFTLLAPVGTVTIGN